MINQYLNQFEDYKMPLWLICEQCEHKFVTRKRSERIIRFCSQKCSSEKLDPLEKEKWINIHKEWENEPRESKIAIMKDSFEKFFDKSDGCWLWKGSKKSKLPYGGFTFRSKNKIAHRASWEIYRGEIPSDLLVLHRCDVPGCVNPDHLFLGTHLDNQRDKVTKGRHKGEKLNPEKVKEIKSLMREDYGDMKISRKYGVSYQTIWHIRIGRTWKDIN